MNPERSKLKLGHPSHAAEIFVELPVTVEWKNNIQILF